MYRYCLSGRQTKETAERGRRLKIALPLPEGADESDPLRLARDLLDVPAHWVRAAEIYECTVLMPLGRGGGLNGVLGHLDHESHNADTSTPRYRIVCLLAEVSADPRPRHEALIQWPGKVNIDGRIYPAEARDE